MLSIDVLSTKPINTVNGQKIVDLTVSSISSSTQGTVAFSNIAVCPYEFEMRPDLFSKLYTGDQNNMGMVLKLNSISNPFSLQMGDVLLIPSISSMTSLLASSQPDVKATSDRTNFRQQLAARISKISPDRQNYLAARNISTSTTSTPLPPNVAAPTDQQFKVQDGKLILGSNIGVSRTSLTTNQSSSSIKTAIAQNNIFSS